jgi:hypothetical protein
MVADRYHNQLTSPPQSALGDYEVWPRDQTQGLWKVTPLGSDSQLDSYSLMYSPNDV